MLNWWHRLSLQVKMTLIIIFIVGVSAVTTEWLEARSIQHTVEDNVRDAALAVGRSVDQNVTSLAQLSNREARSKELEKILANIPDLLNIVLYEFPAQSGDNPLSITSAGPTELPRQEGAPTLVQRVRKERRPLIDYADRTNTHRVFLAAPIFLKNAVVGATYAEFSTLQMDEALESLRQASRTRRLLTGLAIVVAINLFLYFKVHRPVKRLLTAVESVSQGTMTSVLPVEEQDELGELAGTFNDMVRKIREATHDNAQLTESLQAMNDSLQLKVSEATAEVLQKNRALAHTNELLSAAQRDAARAQRLSAIGQVAATVAHKIGTPLTALSGHIQLMAEDPTLSTESRQRLETVEAQIERTSKIIQDMLLYARRPEPVRSPLDLNASVTECLALFRPEFERRKIALVTEWSQQVEKVEADVQQLQEVFNNLIENALDAMPAGGTLVTRIAPHAELEQPDHRTWVKVEFADTGCGMDAEQMAQIFQPFFTTKKARRGTGLGLAIAVETVRAHGGQIKVDSNPGKGSRFTIVLPADGGSR
ncbi:MAG TPA: ATP-binding protein [Nitrospiraceae bacterium]|nr:ATP-binding protein [Nitrospiraceae bacterium]